MTTIDDLARVERELRESFPPTEQMAGYGRRAIYGWADTIAAYIAAQRERDAERDTLAAELKQADADYQDAVTLAQMNKDRLDAALAEVAKLKTENGRLTDVLLSKHGGEPLQLMDELDDARAEVAQVAGYCETLTAAKVELAAELGEARAEVAKLRAACAAKDAALSKALGYVDLDNDALISKCLAALKGTAGTNWIDATGAVEATVRLWSISPSCYGQGVNVAVPDDWAGAPVKIVRVKP